MFYSIRSRLIASFIGVSFLVGAVSLYAGGQLLTRAVLSEAKNRVSLDLNAAHEIYHNHIKLVEVSLNITTLGYGFVKAFKDRDTSDLIFRLGRMSQYASLDFAGVVTAEGATLCRIGPNSLPKEPRASNPIAQLVLHRKASVSGTFVLEKDFLTDENPQLADRARIPLPAIQEKNPTDGRNAETKGMAIAAAVPVFHEGSLLGVLYGGVLLNREQTIVDTVKDTVFLNEKYKDRSIGRASIFLGDMRISTNVLNEEGKRAVGSRVSEDVKNRVLENNERWTQRALVINDWYITAYEAIQDPQGKNVGILGLGVLEEKYTDLRRHTLSVFVLITLAGMALAAILGTFGANRIMNPVRQLIKASRQVTEGSLTPDIGPASHGEIAVLQKTFKEMVAAMGRRRAESQNRLIMSEKQASVGRLAAGVAHEINNPLTGVLTYTHMLLRRRDLSDDIRGDLQTIAEATERVRKIVKGLLDFSRQTKPDRELVDVNKLVGSTIALMENQALVKGVKLSFTPAENLKTVNMDRNQFQSVLLNLIINAMDATKPGDSVTLSTRNSALINEDGQTGIEIEVADTGCGIPPEHILKLFDPFFTTKEVGHGTGLGLSVSLGIVQRHGGTIRVDSEVGKGSTFTVWVPLEGSVKEHENTHRG
jgi:two-component system NtrC family sensor kinase